MALSSNTIITTATSATALLSAITTTIAATPSSLSKNSPSPPITPSGSNSPVVNVPTVAIPVIDNPMNPSGTTIGVNEWGIPNARIMVMETSDGSSCVYPMTKLDFFKKNSSSLIIQMSGQSYTVDTKNINKDYDRLMTCIGYGNSNIKVKCK